MFKVGVTGALIVAHALKGSFGKESRPHRHRYRFEWSFTAQGLDEQGFAVDIARMESVRDRLKSRMNRVFLNDLVFFSNLQPSLENFSVYFLEELLGEFAKTGGLAPSLRQSRIQVWENNTAWASYEKVLGETE